MTANEHTNGVSSGEAIETRLFINNEYVKSKSGQTITVKNPIDDSVVTSEVQVAGPADVDAAVAAARAAFQGGPWKSFTGAQRAACMNKLADLIEANLDGLCRLESIAMGQPIVVGKTFTSLSISQWRWPG
ncbi:hypothetical protein LTR47_011447 [Exophiala xenobiotica]|nr:hypothetical protein LTR47_011447 [Exophiala xenobiotica]KAK5344735.1 hypothetical protein LTR61_011499 [Exophiala xenobiotica]KAK5357834.1 hypothetical protein LTS03_011441 [Exophiala xenobiotica]KAK5470042.1 hypothetical protein LTR55_011214 [Exophiala xenobiotica]